MGGGKEEHPNSVVRGAEGKGPLRYTGSRDEGGGGDEGSRGSGEMIFVHSKTNLPQRFYYARLTSIASGSMKSEVTPPLQQPPNIHTQTTPTLTLMTQHTHTHTHKKTLISRHRKLHGPTSTPRNSRQMPRAGGREAAAAHVSSFNCNELHEKYF